MLVLTRKMGGSIDIDGGTVTITILRVDGKQVKVGIVAPADMAVHRAEVATKIREAGEDPAVRLERDVEPAPTAKAKRPKGQHPWRRNWLWGGAAQRLTDEAARMHREDQAAADAEAERERREAANGGDA